jgi:hypothetical protein
MKEIAVDNFNQIHQDETQYLDCKWKMEYNERMTSLHLK